MMSPSGQQQVSSVSSSVSRAEKIKCSLQITEVIVYVPRGHFNQTCRVYSLTVMVGDVFDQISSCVDVFNKTFPVVVLATTVMIICV